MAARASLNAGLLAYKQNVARQVQDTVVAYWQCLGAQDTLEITDSTRSRADQMFAMVGKLIKGGEMAPNTLNEARAKLFSRDADMESVRLLLYQRRQSLGLAMGFGPERMSDPPLARSPFPVPPDLERLAGLDAPAMVQTSLANRRDYLALKQETEAARILYGRALNYLQPDLKLALRAGYAGLSESSAFERYYNSLGQDMRGLNFLTSLVLELPIQNNAARGEVVRRKSLLEEVRLRADTLAQAVAAEVLVALEALRRSAQELHFASQAEDNYRVAVEVATQRLKLGEGSLNALIDQEDRYFQSRVTKNSASQRYAVALVQLRLATGTLYEDKGEDMVFHPQSFTQVPFLN
jgi:outer membrane protein TolC